MNDKLETAKQLLKKEFGDDWMEIVRMDIETFCPDATFEKVDRWQEN